MNNNERENEMDLLSDRTVKEIFSDTCIKLSDAKKSGTFSTEEIRKLKETAVNARKEILKRGI